MKPFFTTCVGCGEGEPNEKLALSRCETSQWTRCVVKEEEAKCSRAEFAKDVSLFLELICASDARSVPLI